LTEKRQGEKLEKRENDKVPAVQLRGREGGKEERRRLKARNIKTSGNRQGMRTEFEDRTLTFSLAVIRFVAEFPRSSVGDVVGRQLLKSATAVGANYREANRAESREDFIHKTGIAEKEAAETVYWLEICTRGKIGNDPEAQHLLAEANELLAIITTINRKGKNR
jgi:four helix bundle protein